MKAGQAQIAMDGTELLGDKYYFMAHGPWRKFEAIQDEVRKYETHVSYGPRFPRASQLAFTVPPPFLPPPALQLAPHALPRAPYGREPWPHLCQRVQSNMGSWPHMHQNIAETAWLRRHTHITAPLSIAAHCARALCVKCVLHLNVWGGGVDRPTFASGKTVKDFLHGCRQRCSLEN